MKNIATAAKKRNHRAIEEEDQDEQDEVEEMDEEEADEEAGEDSDDFEGDSHAMRKKVVALKKGRGTKGPKPEKAEVKRGPGSRGGPGSKGGKVKDPSSSKGDKKASGLVSGVEGEE